MRDLVNGNIDACHDARVHGAQRKKTSAALSGSVGALIFALAGCANQSASRPTKSVSFDTPQEQMKLAIFCQYVTQYDIAGIGLMLEAGDLSSQQRSQWQEVLQDKQAAFALLDLKIADMLDPLDPAIMERHKRLSTDLNAEVAKFFEQHVDQGPAGLEKYFRWSNQSATRCNRELR